MKGKKSISLKDDQSMEIDLDKYSIFNNYSNSNVNSNPNQSNKKASKKQNNQNSLKFQYPALNYNYTYQFPSQNISLPVSYPYSFPYSQPIPYSNLYPYPYPNPNPLQYNNSSLINQINPINTNFINFYNNQPLVQIPSTKKEEDSTELILILKSKTNLTDYLLKPAGTKKIQKYLATAEEADLDYLFSIIKNDFGSLMLNTFSNYFCQKLFPLVKQKQRLSIWKSIKTNIKELSCHKHSTYCVQLLIKISNGDDEQLKIISYIEKEFLELAKNKQGAYVLKEILINFSNKAKLCLENFMIDNMLDIAKDKYAIGIFKFFLNGKQDSQIRERVVNNVASSINDYLFDNNRHFLILYFLENWKLKDFMTIVTNMINILKKMLFDKYSSRVLKEMIKKGITMINEALFSIILLNENDILIELTNNELTFQILILFYCKQTEINKSLLYDFVKERILIYKDQEHGLSKLCNKWYELTHTDGLN